MMNTNFRRNAIQLLAVVVAASVYSPVAAQYAVPATPGAVGPSFGAAAALPGGALDGPVWLRYSPTNDGLGYDHGYTTAGALIPLWNTAGDAIWFVESQGHLSSEGRFFGNIGVGRRIYEAGLRRTFGASLWFDYDSDRYETFGHDFQQGGINVDSFGDLVDFHINGYFPFQDGYVLGPSSPGFFQNNIMLIQGLDSGLRGTDSEVGIRLPVLSQVDPRAYIGGYYYGSGLVDPFLGISGRMEIHPTEYTTAQLRVTHDERFGVSTMFNFELHLGGRKNRPAFDRITEPVHRNDHIVRYHQNPLYAVDPLTGLPYRVVHVDASAANPGLGTFERPFTTLAQAQAGSIPHDIIYLYGDNTYTGGIALKEYQQLLGTGFPLVLRNGVLTMITAPTIQETRTVDVNGIPMLVQTTLNNRNSINFKNDSRFLTLTGLPTGIVAASGNDVVDINGNLRGLVQYQSISTADTYNNFDILITDGSRPTPTITNPAGAGVILSNFNQVANLNIVNSQQGILGNGVSGFDLHTNRITGNSNTSEGIVLENIHGVGLIRNNRIVNNNRPNPPVTPNAPFKDGLRMSVNGNDSALVGIVGNLINNNDTGIRINSTTSGQATFNLTDNITNNNVNDGIRALGAGPGVLTISSVGSGTIVDAATGLAPVIPNTAPNAPPGSTVPVTIQAAQSSLNGTILKVTDTDGNGRGFFADILDGQFGLLLRAMTFDGNDSSFFPRYGSVQLNLEPEVDAAFMTISGNQITRTGFHVTSDGVSPTDSLDAGSGIRLVSNPGLGVTHRLDILSNNISDNFGDGIKLLMLTEGIRTASLPQGTLIANVRGNTINNNQGIADDNGTSTSVVLNTTPVTTFPYPRTDFSDDFDSDQVPPIPPAIPVLIGQQGLASNPDPKNEFTNNINGSGVVVRAKGTDDSRLYLNISDNRIRTNAFDAINMAFAGQGYIDYVQGTAGALTPQAAFTANFGVNATVVIDNNDIAGGPTTGTTVAGVSDDLIKVTLLDRADVAMQISNNQLASGTLAAGLPVANAFGRPTQDVGFDTAIEIDTWDTSRLMLVVDNNDIFDSGTGTFTDGGIDLRSHDNSVMAVRITRNRINDIADSNSLAASGTNSAGGVAGTGAGINLLAEGNSTMIAFVNNNDLFNTTTVGNYFEATVADTASLCLQLLDNNAQPGNSPQANETFTLTGFAFYLVQTENSVFELEPTRGTNHSQQQPESLSFGVFTSLLLAPPGAVLPAAGAVQYGNVATGACQARLNALFSDFPFTPDVIGFSNFDPPVVHP